MKYLAYFQAYTNTYDSLENLKAKYEEALRVPGVVGLVIGTRPDCMPDSLLDYLDELHRRSFLLVEYGVESIYDKTLLRIHRGHTHAQTVDAIRRTAERGIPVGAHIILGLPGEKGTQMAAEYAASPEDFHLFTADEYVDLVIDFLERLRPDFVLERFVSQSPASLLARPGWGLKNHEFVAKVKRRLQERDTCQGRLYRLDSSEVG